jgi:hypothetical protein
MQFYKDYMRQRGLEQFTLDGAINPEAWRCSSTRIMFYLKENYGYKQYREMDIQKYAEGWLKAKNKTYVKSVLLASALHHGIQKGEPLSQKEFDSMPLNDDLMQETLRKCAIVNVKKNSGNSSSNDREIRIESRKNAALLVRQITDLDPSIIIAGSTVCWHSLVIDLGLFEEAKDCPRTQATKCRGKVLCHSYHPAARRKSQFDVFQLHSTIVKANFNLK